MNTSTEITELAKALHQFQGKVGKLKKSATNPFFKSSYAPLNEVIDVLSDPLQETGLSFVQFPTGDCGLTTRIMHTSGQWMEDSYTMKPAKADPQGHGSAISYQKRYALVAIFGLNDGDDDGNDASKPPVKPVSKSVQQQPSVQPIAPKPTAQPTTDTSNSDNQLCPECGGQMWDARPHDKGGKGKYPKTNPKAPDWKCKDKACGGAVWVETEKDFEAMGADNDYGASDYYESTQG